MKDSLKNFADSVAIFIVFVIIAIMTVVLLIPHTLISAFELLGKIRLKRINPKLIEGRERERIEYYKHYL